MSRKIAEKRIKKMLWNFDAKKNLESIKNPTEIPDMLLEYLRFFGADCAMKHKTSFFPKFPATREIFPSGNKFQDIKGQTFPVWRFIISVSSENSFYEAFGFGKKYAHWGDLCKALIPPLIEKTSSVLVEDDFRYETEMYVFARDLPLVKDYMLKTKLIDSIFIGLKHFTILSLTRKDWEESRQKAILMSNVDTALLVVNENRTQMEDKLLQAHKDRILKEDISFFKKMLADREKKIGVSLQMFEELREFIGLEVVNKWSAGYISSRWERDGNNNLV